MKHDVDLGPVITLHADVQKAEEALAAARAARDEAIRAAVRDGAPLNAVARAIDMTWPGVQRIVKAADV